MVSDFAEETLSPYMNDEVSEEILRKGALSVCDYVISNFNFKSKKPTKTEKQLAAMLLEALGYIPIAENTPLSCGHDRKHGTTGKVQKTVRCQKCHSEKYVRRNTS